MAELSATPAEVTYVSVASDETRLPSLSLIGAARGTPFRVHTGCLRLTLAMVWAAPGG